MTVVLDVTATISEPEPTAEVRPASWGARAGALALDILPALGVIATCVVLALTAPFDGWVRWLFTVLAAVVFVLTVVNRLVLPAVKGWTLGRALFGIAVRRADGRTVGIGRLTVREVAHLLDTLSLFVGWLWPLWDSRRRTFADMVARTRVVRVASPRRDMRRVAAGVLIATMVAAVAAVGLGYALIFREQRALDSAREQVAEQGPRIVEQMLSYHVDTLVDDFARAQTLTTDGYRPQLIDQQQAVQGAGPVNNEYWAVNSAVLTDPPVTANRVSMLLAMQGQRGTNAEDMKLITATVQVDFEKAADGQWKVANLTVLKRPMMNTGGG